MTKKTTLSVGPRVTSSQKAYTPVIELVPGIQVLTKQELYNSGLPGAQFTRDLAHPSTSRVSLGRMLTMGLLGGLAGYGVSRKVDRHRGVGTGTGASLGVLGSLAYDKWKGDPSKDVDVVGALSDDNGKGTIVIAGPSELAKAMREHRRPKLKEAGPKGLYTGFTPFVPILVTNPKAYTPPGWAGAVIQHGMLVQSAQINYVYNHAGFRKPFQVSVYKGYRTSSWKTKVFEPSSRGIDCTNCDRTVYDNSTLFTERFVEWPSPVWPRFGLGTRAIGDIPPSGLKLELANHILNHKLGDRPVWEQGWEHAHLAYAMPYKVAGAYQQNDPKVSGFWASGNNMNEYIQRYDPMVRNAQWFVWAGEMLRLHSNPMAIPDGWRDHCAQWGVGCATTKRVYGSNKTLMTDYDGKEWCEDPDGNRVGNSLKVPLAPNVVKEYLELIMLNTPAPFTSSPLDQMNVGVGYRMMMDYPMEIMDSLRPPLGIIGKDYFGALVQKQLAAGMPKNMRVFLYIVAAVVEIIATYFGGPVGMIFGSAFSGIVSMCMTNCNNPSSRRNMSVTDIVRMVGGMLSSVVDNLGVDLSDTLKDMSGGFVDFLEQLAESAGPVADVLAQITDIYDGLSRNLGWDFADDFLGTMQDAGSSINRGADYIEGEIAKL